MFEVFEPVIRQNCGKILALATIGFVSSVYVGFSIVANTIHYVMKFF